MTNTHYLLSGSFAYDTILKHDGYLETSILPESVARLNVSFGIDNVEDEYGGTGGNIAYNASLLDQTPLLVGSLGSKDSKDYLKKLASYGLSGDSLTIVEGVSCPHAWILTDKNNNQITSFSSGSMKYTPKLPTLTPDIWHLAPENPLTMAKLIVEAKSRNQPSHALYDAAITKKEFFFDPGQMLPYFLEGMTNSVLPLDDILKNVKALFLNEYEAELLTKHYKTDLPSLVNKYDFFVVNTLGKDGVIIYTKDDKKHIGVAKTNKIVDPTGCGDAFRAGFLYGYTKNMPLEYCAQVGSTMGSFAIEYSGGQNHKPTGEDINNRLYESFGVTLNEALKAKNPLRI